MDKYTPIRTHAQLVEALRRGLTVEINSKSNESAADYQAPPGGGWVAGLPAVTTAADDPNSYAWRGFAFRAVGEHDLSPAQNADFNPGDIVRYKGKEWRVQGIDDNDPNAGLLLLDVAEPVDAPDFVDTVFPITRGGNRRPENGPGHSHRWCWGHAKKAELVSRGESEARVGGEDCHCATCTCKPGMTPAVRFDTSPVEREGAVRDHLIRMGWTPPRLPTADKFVATFRCESNGIVGLRRAPIHSVSMHDDGIIEVVIDHWPEPPAAQQPAAVDEAMVERIAALLHEEATDEPWTVAGVEHPGPDRDYYRELARKVAALAACPSLTRRANNEAHHHPHHT